jgi:phosphoglycerol transferase
MFFIALLILGISFPYIVFIFIDTLLLYSLFAPVTFCFFTFFLIKKYGVLGRISTIPLIVCFSTISVAYGGSIYMQGVGFNEQFFFHLDPETMKVAVKQYSLLFYSTILVMSLVLFLPLVINIHSIALVLKKVARVHWLVYCIIFSVSFIPLHSYVEYVYQKMSDDSSSSKFSELEVPSAEIAVQDLERQPKNLIFLYLESVEQLYFDELLYPELLPNLQALKAANHDYTNVKQVGITGFTIAGIVASQCGVPLNIRREYGEVSNTALATLNRPLEGYICLGDILKAYNYSTVMYKGASLSFSGTRNFLDYHGFSETKGAADWDLELPSADRTGWGIYDDTLFDLAFNRISQLYNDERPFALSLVTLDTHHPNGHASKSCPKYTYSDDTMLDALHCTDYLVGKFVEKLRQNNILDDTVLVIFSDHLAMRNTQWELLKKHKEERRLTFIVVSGEEKREFNKAATHFDITPTTLDYLGIPGYEYLMGGRSLKSDIEGAWFSDDLATEKKYKIHTGAYGGYIGKTISIKDGFNYSYVTQTIYIDETAFKVNINGASIHPGQVFGIVFDKNGLFYNIFADDDILEAGIYNGYFLIMVSLKENKTEAGNQSMKISYGIFGEEMIEEDLWWDLEVSASQLTNFFY